MPESISLIRNASKFRLSKDWLGTKVPWEVKSYSEDMLAMETVGGIFDLSAWATIEIKGKDSVDYLNRMTTVNFKTLPEKNATYGAFLTGKGTVVALGVFIRSGESTLFITSELQRQKALEHIEQFHFAESFETKDLSSEFAYFGWANPSKETLGELQIDKEIKPGMVEWRRWKSMDIDVWKDVARKDFFFLKIQRKKAENFLFEMERMSIHLLGHRAYENYRIRSSIPEFGVDLSDHEIILESGFDLAVARNKGCYPGQEVVERIFTYGSVNKKLILVELNSKNFDNVSLPLELKENESKVGTLVSISINAKDSTKGWGLAYLQKGHWESNKTFSI